MKVRESGMPDAGIWEGFFDPFHVLRLLGLDASIMDAVEFGCGYGTFAVPAAGIIGGTLHAFDIDPVMIEATMLKADYAGTGNLQYHLRDFVLQGTGLQRESMDYCMLFNILHAEDPRALLHEAHTILRPGGKMVIMHWNCDPETPRGPPMEIRPKPEDCRKWAEEEGFVMINPQIDLPPYHYGMVGKKRKNKIQTPIISSHRRLPRR